MTSKKSWITSPEVPDWNREKPRQLWDPSRRLLASIRKYQEQGNKTGIWATLYRKWWVVQHKFWSIITQTEIDLKCQIGGGLLLPHPNGIVIHPDVRIGPNCLIFQQVTIGTRGKAGVPTVGTHADIGAGAKILGPVVLGDHCVIGANAVVISDVPPNSTATGIPATTIDQNRIVTQTE